MATGQSDNQVHHRTSNLLGGHEKNQLRSNKSDNQLHNWTGMELAAQKSLMALYFPRRLTFVSFEYRGWPEHEQSRDGLVQGCFNM
jgi:hypothetical protein